MAKAEKEKLLDLIERMPGFSSTVSKIISLAKDPNSSPTDLVNTISMDAVLTAKLLKLINSAYFGLLQPIVSLNRAVIMLGFNDADLQKFLSKLQDCSWSPLSKTVPVRLAKEGLEVNL